MVSGQPKRDAIARERKRRRQQKEPPTAPVPAATTRRAAATACGWCGGAIDVKATGRIPQVVLAGLPTARLGAVPRGRVGARRGRGSRAGGGGPRHTRADTSARGVAGAAERTRGATRGRPHLRPRPTEPQLSPERASRRLQAPPEPTTRPPVNTRPDLRRTGTHGCRQNALASGATAHCRRHSECVLVVA